MGRKKKDEENQYWDAFIASHKCIQRKRMTTRKKQGECDISVVIQHENGKPSNISFTFRNGITKQIDPQGIGRIRLYVGGDNKMYFEADENGFKYAANKHCKCTNEYMKTHYCKELASFIGNYECQKDILLGNKIYIEKEMTQKGTKVT